MRTSIKQQARFDARLSLEQKQIFERAAYLGGFRSLTDFIILTVQERAKEIIREKEFIIASERDSQIFFEAIMNPKRPSTALNEALDYFNSYMSNAE